MSEYLLFVAVAIVVCVIGSSHIWCGTTVLEDGDRVISASREFDGSGSGITIERHPLSGNSRWNGRKVREYRPATTQLMLIQRGDESIIPHGDTVLESGDVLYINRTTVKEMQ